MRYELAIATLVLLCGATVHGNDTLVTLAAGGLVPLKSSEIVMESEDLAVSTGRIAIRYVFRNTSAKGVEATVAFPLPELDGGTVYNEPINLPASPKVNFVDFEARTNGKPIATKVEARAFSHGQDVTARLRTAGLPINVVFPALAALNSAILKLPEETRRGLEQEELIVPGDFNPRLPGVGKHGWWPTWSMRVRYYWTQQFPANSTVELLQSYRPVVGGSYLVGTTNDAEVGEIAKPYCGGDAALRQVATYMQSHPPKQADDIVLYERTIDYILTTANNWNGPIRHFHLAISTGGPEDILLTCMPGVQRVAPTRYETTKQDFRPSSELELMILQGKSPLGKRNGE